METREEKSLRTVGTPLLHIEILACCNSKTFHAQELQKDFGAWSTSPLRISRSSLPLRFSNARRITMVWIYCIRTQLILCMLSLYFIYIRYLPTVNNLRISGNHGFVSNTVVIWDIKKSGNHAEDQRSFLIVLSLEQPLECCSKKSFYAYIRICIGYLCIVKV